MTVGVAELFKADPTLKPRMYEDYRNYYLARGVVEDMLMTYEEWQAHLRIQDI